MKKVVLFIVEGITDKICLENIMDTLIDTYSSNHRLLLEITNGDITSDYTVQPNNVKKKLTEIIKGYGKRKYKSNDYKEIIHIIDMDGAFIDESLIHEDVEQDEFRYDLSGIYYRSKEKVIKRNDHKKKIIETLINTSTVFRNVKYRVFFLSCNLEHVFHNKLNVDVEDKVVLAKKFEKEYEEDIDKFIEFICNSKFSCKKEYCDSWKFIKVDNNSIKRYTNLDIIINEYCFQNDI